MSAMAFLEEFKERQVSAEHVIEQYLPEETGYLKDLTTAMNYSVRAGGKRLRPVLIESFCRLFGGDRELASPFMAAMEYLHTYSLVHDDMPEIDNDDYRRGMLTTHKKFGVQTGLLAGDALLHHAYDVAIDIFSKNIESGAGIKALKIFSNKTGIYGMLGGQAADVLSTGSQPGPELLDYIYRYKTGALIEGSMMIGAVLGSATKEELHKVEEAGARLGMAFQIKDDLLDLYGDETKLGKPVLSDEKNNKYTYVTLHGSQKSQEDVERLTTEAVSIIEELHKDREETVFLKELFSYLTSREN